MSRYPTPFNDADPYSYGAVSGAGSSVLSRFFSTVYAWMTAGLALTALIAFVVGNHPQILQSLGGGVWLLFILQLGLVFAISYAINKISANVATLLFLLYAAINGVVLGAIFFLYAKAVIGQAFAITAGTFGITSLYGYMTGRDLSRIGSLCFMGLIGIILASIVSFFWHSTMLVMAINYIGVLVFVGLTAYDTQRLKQVAYQTEGNPAMANRLAINGALMLYLDFLNLFLFILSILSNGDNRRR